MKASTFYSDTILVSLQRPKNYERNGNIQKYVQSYGNTKADVKKRIIYSFAALSVTPEYKAISEDMLVKFINYNQNLFVQTEDLTFNNSLALLNLIKNNDVSDPDLVEILNFNQIDIESKALNFMVYFMVSFFNLNHLTEDFQDIFLNAPDTDYWSKTGYINQTVSEIYREDFLFTILLEFLYCIATRDKDFINSPINAIEKIYNQHLSFYEKRFTTKYIDKYFFKAEADLLPKYEISKAIVNAIDLKTWDRFVSGKLSIRTSKISQDKQSALAKTNRNDFRIPDEITNLSESDIISIFNLIYELFLLKVDTDEVRTFYNNSVELKPSLLPEYFYKASINDTKKYNAENMDRIGIIDVDHFRHEEYFMSVHDALNGGQREIHYVINEKIIERIDYFTENFNGITYKPKFIPINL